MIVLAGADIVLPDRILSRASLLLDDDRIVAIDPRERVEPSRATIIDAPDHYIVPGFVDVHVHGVLGRDTLDGGDAIDAIAARLPKFGVTAFCPTTVACTPGDLTAMLRAVRDARVSPVPGRSRVLPAHLESNFINPEYRGAQPLECIRTAAATPTDRDFTGPDVLDVIAAHRADVGIVTLAPEMPGGFDLLAKFVAAGHIVSIGHTGATYEEAEAAIDAGVRHSTHLFNRMTPLSHRSPGVAGAVLSRPEVCAELICDGYHVHPAVCRVAIATKGTTGTMAITDATGCAGLAVGSTARLGGRTITVGERAALLPDGTLAGSTLTMDRAFRNIVALFGGSVVDAAHLCATSPARQLQLTGFGVLASGAVADLVVLDRGFRVVRTFIAGREVYSREHSGAEFV